MPGLDGTGPRGQGMFTGRGEGYCMLRFPEQGESSATIGYAGIEGWPVMLTTHPVAQPRHAGGRCRCGRRRTMGQGPVRR